MRPKLVLVIMLLTVGLVGLAVMLKSTVLGNRDVAPQTLAPAGDSGDTSPNGATNEIVGVKATPQPPITNVPQPPITNVLATTPDQDHQEAIRMELEQVNEVLLAGGSEPGALESVRERFLSNEAEVRKAAVDVARQLNDRGAIPKLREAMAKVEEPREKTAILDAIEYLETPSGETSSDDEQMSGSTTNLGSDPARGNSMSAPGPRPARNQRPGAKK